MGRSDFWKPGQYNTICDICGFKYKNGDLRKRWDGLMVCPNDWNPRQPQDFVRGIADPQPPPWTRPEGQDTFVPIITSILLDTNGDEIRDTLGFPILGTF
jgi:hypothetical protein